MWLEGDNGEKGYFTNSWYTYNETIFKGISQRGVMTNTDYLKTRKIIAGLVNYDDIKGLQKDMIGRKQFTSVIVNNLNKTSINGDFAKVNEANELYKPFKFGDNIL